MSTPFPLRSDSRLIKADKVVSAAADALMSPPNWYASAKSGLDVAAAALLFVATAPLLLAAMLLVKISSPGPAMYVQLRMGRGGRPFAIYKIRTMTYGCEKLTGVQWSKPGDARVFPLGRWLRRTHLDELPQLWNVMRGDMSLIGPRPERPEFVSQLEKALPHYRSRLLLRPGVTGLAQIQLPPDSDLNSVRDKLAYDLHYLKHVSFWLDLRILAATAGKLIGLPFSFIRACFGFPEKENIVANYKNLGQNAGRPAPKQPGRNGERNGDWHRQAL